MRDLSLLHPDQHAAAVALDKAEQLGLWGPLATHQVRAHLAQGPHGPHVVTAHESHHHAAAPAPPVSPAPAPAPTVAPAPAPTVAPGQAVQLIGAEVKVSPVVMGTVRQRRGVTFAELGTHKHEWRAVDVKGFAEPTEDGHALPIWDVPAEYAPVQTTAGAGSSMQTLCQLCGAEIKDAFPLVNDRRKLQMNVGRVCIEKHAETIDPGVVQAVQQLARATKIKPEEVGPVNALLARGVPLTVAVGRARARRVAEATYERNHPQPTAEESAWWERRRQDILPDLQAYRRGDYVSRDNYNRLKDPFRWRIGSREVVHPPRLFLPQSHVYHDRHYVPSLLERRRLGSAYRFPSFWPAEKVAFFQAAELADTWTPELIEQARAAGALTRSEAPTQTVYENMAPEWARLEEPLAATWARLRNKAGSAAEVRAAVKYDPAVARAASLHEQHKAGQPLGQDDRDWIDSTWASIPAPVSQRLRNRDPALGLKLRDLLEHLSKVATSRAEADVAQVEAIGKAQPAAVIQRWRDLDVSRLPPIELGPPPSPNRDPYPYAGSVVYQGLPLLIENAVGSTRSGKGEDGTPWSITMLAHYGEIADTVAVDGDPLDVYVGPVPDAPSAYVVHQKVAGTERWDEDKIILGVNTAAEAEALYRAHYDRPGFFGGLTRWPLDELKAAIRSRRYHRKRLDTPAWVREKLGKALALGTEELVKCGGGDGPGRGELVVGMLGRVVAGPLVARILQEQQTLPIDLVLERLGLVRQLVEAALALAQARRQLDALALVQRDLAQVGPLSALEKAEQVGLFGFAPAGPSKPRASAARPGRPAPADAPEPHQPALFARLAVDAAAPAPAAPVVAPAPQHPPGEGWMPIAGSLHGGQHRRATDGTWEYWYPSSATHPGGVQPEHHPDDVEAVGRAEGRKLMLRLTGVNAGQPDRIYREYRPDSDDAPGVHLLSYYDVPHLGVGSVVYAPDGEAWSATAMPSAEGVGVWAFKSSRGRTRHFDERWAVTAWIEELHEAQMRAASSARRATMVERLRSGLRAAEVLQRVAAKDPTVETVSAAVNATRAAVDAGSGLRPTAHEWAEHLGWPMKRPRSWEALVHEHQQIATELRARLPGTQWSELHDGCPLHMLAATPELARKALRMRWLGEMADDHNERSTWSEDWEKQPVQFSVHAVLKEMKPDRDGRFTPESVGAALKAIWTDYSSRSSAPPRSPASRRVIINAIHQLSYTHGVGTPEDQENQRAKAAAVAEYAALSGNRTLFLSSADHSLAWKATRPIIGRAQEELVRVIDDVTREAGAVPCPELYGDEIPQAIDPTRVQVELKLRAKRSAEDDEARPALTAMAALLDRHEDPIVTIQIPTGERVRPDPALPSYSYENRAVVTLPLSMAAALLNTRANAEARALRTFHQQRATRLKSALAKVEEAVGDPARFVEQATADYLHGAGHPPEQVAAALKVMRERGRDLIPVSWRAKLWRTLHPDLAAEQERLNSTERPDQEQLKRDGALRAHRDAFHDAIRQAQATGVLDGLRTAIGHPTDLAAAVAKIHPPAPKLLEARVATGGGKTGDITTTPAKPYDIHADPSGLRRLLGWCHRDVVPAVDIRVHQGAGRAHCGHNNSIALAAGDVRMQAGVGRVAIHEYGHAIEHGLPEVTELVNTLRDERARGQRRVNLAELHPEDGYDAHEVTYPDSWASSYTGKWYGHQSSTEVLSMGVEQLMTDPVGFSQRDRQHFLITVGALSGLLGTKRKAVHATEKEKAT